MVLPTPITLHLQAGEAVVAEAGGLQPFHGLARAPAHLRPGGIRCSAWGASTHRRPRRVCLTRSPRDGCLDHAERRQRSMEIKMALGADVVMAF